MYKYQNITIQVIVVGEKKVSFITTKAIKETNRL